MLVIVVLAAHLWEQCRANSHKVFTGLVKWEKIRLISCLEQMLTEAARKCKDCEGG